MTTKKRIAIWAAVSTPQQARIDKDSLSLQLRDLAGLGALPGDLERRGG